MIASKAASSASTKTIVKTNKKSNMKMIRTVAGYAALAIGVSVGGVVVGAIVVAPAVSRATPLFSTNAATSSETNGSVGQADGDGAASQSATNVVAAAPFKSMAEVIGSTTQMEANKAVKPVGPSGLQGLKREVGFFYEDALDFVGRVPKTAWLYVDFALVAMFAGVWAYRRRRSGSNGAAKAAPVDSGRRSAASLPAKLVAGKGSRTPKAVVALAEAGTSQADIARRTGLPLDAVAMLLSLGSFGGRQLQPPTA